MPGAAIGLITGFGIGHSFEYEFHLTEESGSTKKTRIEKSSTGTAALRLKNGIIERSLTDFDVIHLKNGNSIRGTIVGEVGDGEYLVRVTIRKWDGETHTYEAVEIERIQRQTK